MLGIFSSLMKTATRQDHWSADTGMSEHDAHLGDHERRKAEELRKLKRGAYRHPQLW